MKIKCPRDLGDGLLLRRASREDAGKLGLEGEWSRELLCGPPPGVLHRGSFVVEDTHTGIIASAVLCLSHTWAYGGIKFPVCQVAAVGTEPSYRHRGLVRAQMEAVHEWTGEGELQDDMTMLVARKI